ncbi:MAPEG family protein [Brevundimonas lenta]|uniref:Glutathione S-transferase n=1 Tax=Brevundimonas lenta TaxID=424796 RepID=A0A7W6JGJ2_9CAUL|nr:MAPEG family protein [Brevundimonas lenta]MBB4083701.1 hypothetical protein [Brevundimonas lenta]
MSNVEALTFHTESFQAVALWAGLSLLLLLILSIRISLGRRRLKVSTGDGGHAELTATTRAFGNAVEYVPITLIALVILAIFYSALVIHVIGGAFVLGRILHAWGMGQQKQPALGRMLGMALTHIPLIAAALLLIVASFL